MMQDPVVKAFFRLQYDSNIFCNVFSVVHDIDGLVQERRISFANALQLRLSCTNPSICADHFNVLSMTVPRNFVPFIFCSFIQCNCRDVCKISLWSVKYVLN